jgi:hypothetical protein
VRRPCNALRCTSCDFKVLALEDRRWDDTVDYLFLRNNMPDVQKLRAKLVPAKGARVHVPLGDTEG